MFDIPKDLSSSPQQLDPLEVNVVNHEIKTSMLFLYLINKVSQIKHLESSLNLEFNHQVFYLSRV